MIQMQRLLQDPKEEPADSPTLPERILIFFDPIYGDQSCKYLTKQNGEISKSGVISSFSQGQAEQFQNFGSPFADLHASTLLDGPGRG